MKYPCSVATTWNTTIEQLGSAAADLLRTVSWLAPDPIPRTLLRSGELQDALAELANYSMARLEADGDRFRVHRLVQEVTCERQSAEVQATTIRAALDLLVAAATADPDDVRTWPLWDLMRPHVAAVTAHADMRGITEQTSLLMSQLALLLFKKALHTEAEPLMRRALAIDEQSFGADHPDVAIRLNNLAGLLKATNRLAEAEPLMRRALKNILMFTHVTGHEHPHLRAVFANYVGILQSIGLSEAVITQKLNEVFAEAGQP